MKLLGKNVKFFRSASIIHDNYFQTSLGLTLAHWYQTWPTINRWLNKFGVCPLENLISTLSIQLSAIFHTARWFVLKGHFEYSQPLSPFKKLHLIKSGHQVLHKYSEVIVQVNMTNSKTNVSGFLFFCLNMGINIWKCCYTCALVTYTKCKCIRGYYKPWSCWP